MKSFKALCFMLAILTFQSPLAKAQEGGHWVGNGGDSLALTIYEMAENISRKLNSLTPECGARLDIPAQRFAEILSRVEIETSPEPLYLENDGKMFFKEAINYPAKGVIIFHRDSFSSSVNQEQLIIHEFLGLAGISDEGYQTTQLIYRTLRNPACLDGSYIGPESEKINSLQLGEIPIATEIDSDGMLYFIVPGRDRIFRYSIAAQSYVAPLETKDEPKLIAVSKVQKRIYVAYENNQVTYFDLNSSYKEQDFITFVSERIPSPHDPKGQHPMHIERLITVGSKLVLIPYYGAGSSRAYVYFKTGKLNQISQAYYSSTYVNKDDSRMRLYYFPFISPKDLNFINLNKNTGYFSEDTPYHGEYHLDGDIVVSPTLIAVGSGIVLSNPDLTYVSNLSSPFDQGEWVGKSLFVTRNVSGGFELEGLNAPNLNRFYKRHYDSGAVVGLHSWGGRLILVYATETGELKIETVNTK